MTTPSFLAKVARILLMTGLTVVALMLLATYASVSRAPGMMRGWSSANESAGGTRSMSFSQYAGDAPGMMGFDSSAITLSSSPTSSAQTFTFIDDDSSRIIKTGSVDMTSNDVPATVTAISTLVTAPSSETATDQGFVAESSGRENSKGEASAFMTVRVPVSRFETTITAIKNLGVHVSNESISGEDVTEQYTDLSARLTAAQAQEAQYLVILKTATSVGDVLAVQEHLANVRLTIESLQGQIGYLENRTALATITVSISEEPTATQARTDKFSPARDANAAVALVIVLGQRALSAMIWIAIIGAAIGIPVAIAATIYWMISRRQRDTKKRR